MANSRKTETQAVNYRNVKLFKPDKGLVDLYKAFKQNIRDKLNYLNSVYANKKVPKSQRDQMLKEDLARYLGVPGIIMEAGYRAGKKYNIFLASITDDKGEQHYINVDAYPMYLAMVEEAHKLGIVIHINESFRTMEQQTFFYNRYRTWLQSGKPNPPVGKAARPGHSRHQMGLALDIGKTGDKDGELARAWLSVNGPKFGWYRTVKSEAWHFSFLADRIASVDGSGQYINDLINKLNNSLYNLGSEAGFTSTAFHDIVRNEADALARADIYTHFSRRDGQNAQSNLIARASINLGDKVMLETYLSETLKMSVQLTSPVLPNDSPFLFSFETGLWGDLKPGGTIDTNEKLVKTSV